MHINLKQFIKYIIAGLINTFVGYGIFCLFYLIIKFTPELSNAIGYMVALLMAFVLNRFYVFSEKMPAESSFLRFIISFACAFIINQFVLYILIKKILLEPQVAQIYSMIVYSIAFYLFNPELIDSK